MLSSCPLQTCFDHHYLITRVFIFFGSFAGRLGTQSALTEWALELGREILFITRRGMRRALERKSLRTQALTQEGPAGCGRAGLWRETKSGTNLEKRFAPLSGLETRRNLALI